MSTHASASPSASPSPASTARLTRKQAAAAYVRIIDRSNRYAAATQTDISDRVPWAQFTADTHAYIAGVRKVDRELAASRWPAQVQPYITAMIATYDRASIGCSRAEIRAGSYAAAGVADVTSADCQAADAGTLPDTVRQRLGLPARG